MTAATLADGSVLVAGGRSFVSLWPEAYRYFPATNEWQPAGSLAAERMLATGTTLPDGRVLVAGGNTMVNDPVRAAAADRYDPATNTWSSAGAMSTARTAHAATSLADGRVLVVGGQGFEHALQSAELYDPAANTWSPAAPMSVTRIRPTATRLADGRVLVTGGETTSGTALKSTELYDPATNTWAPGPDLDVPRAFHTATLLDDGTVLIVGGLGSGATLLYDPAENAFTPGPGLPKARERHTATKLLDGDVLIAGAGPNLRYRHRTHTLVSAGNSEWSTIGHVAALLGDGRVLVAGGSQDNSIVSGRAEIWTPFTTVDTPASVDFGPVSAPEDRTITLTNTGSGDLLVDELHATGAAFSVAAATCGPNPVAAGASCTVTLHFAPPALGSHTGALTFAVNSPAGTVTVPLSGTLMEPSREPTVTPPTTPRSEPSPVTNAARVRVPVSGHVRGRSRCSGKATLTLVAGETRIARATVRLTSRCVYRKTFTVRRAKLGSRTRLTLQVRFASRTSRSTVKLAAR